MLKKRHQSLRLSSKLNKHQQEMDVLRAHHERLLSNETLRQATLVGAGLFVRASDGKLAAAKPYAKVITGLPNYDT